MKTPVAVTKFQVKSHVSPDEVRSPSKTRVEVCSHEGFTIGRFNFEPGWRWSECVKPVAKTDLCQVSHVGYAVSGKIRVRMSDGTEKTIGEERHTRFHLGTMPGLKAVSVLLVSR